ncbi:glycosyltransferase [Sphingobacterium sp. UME9]|uniref:glycosyltransferase n=1 Tax=Sphingobacterium sp. UME9 TaxID=1862316 RepID=UPI001601CA94|nr:glycosyltransferase [Sphingobacterium sp. UME9]MBB1645555.1 hypothetical protein [Sphingobacterium sp. UME9]
MNILFLYGSTIDPEKGGIQRVTEVLTNCFVDRGFSVFYLSLIRNSDSFNKERQFFLPNQDECLNIDNVDFLLKLIDNYKIDIVINQAGMHSQLSQLAYYAKKAGVKLISCIHNSFLSPIKHFDITYYNDARKKGLHFLLPLTKIKIVKDTLLWFYKRKYQDHYKSLYKNSDRVVLLSNSFKAELEFFLGKKVNENKVVAISNPTSFAVSDENEKYLGNKKKQILHVGRIDIRQKRVDLLIEIWSKISPHFPDWILKIVGDGPDLAFIKNIVQQKGLKNVEFEGFKNPVEFYKDSPIFCMTSAYEGFGIVLVEAMTFGSIPLAFDSYASASDIIDSGKNGFLIKPFDVDAYVTKVIELIQEENKRIEIGQKCLLKAIDFTIDEIGQRWQNLFIDLFKN